MSNPIQTSLNQYSIPNSNRPGAVFGGIEKECLRVTPAGHISMRQHPKALGSALPTHTTTDFSEALLEFITQPMPTLKIAKDAGKHSSLSENLKSRRCSGYAAYHALTTGY